MGVFAAVASLFKRSSDTIEEEQVNEVQEVINESVTIQSTLPVIDDIPVVPSFESIPTVHKIEDVSSTSSSSPGKHYQFKLPGFEDDPIIPSKAKKKPIAKKVNTKLPRKSTAKRKK